MSKGARTRKPILPAEAIKRWEQKKKKGSGLPAQSLDVHENYSARPTHVLTPFLTEEELAKIRAADAAALPSMQEYTILDKLNDIRAGKGISKLNRTAFKIPKNIEDLYRFLHLRF